MFIFIGSARHDENGKYIGGKVGDQLQTSKTADANGEVSMQPFYIHKKGWNVCRPVSSTFATNLAEVMIRACNNDKLGYSQGCQRKTPDDIDTLIPINVDCSKLVRNCIYKATHVDVGNFDTASEVGVLDRCGLFEKHFAFKSLSSTPIYDGDVLVSKTKGHTVIVVAGSPRPFKNLYFNKYGGTSSSIVTALKSVGVTDTSLSYRGKIAKANGISNYVGTSKQNTQLLILLKQGKLLKP